MQQQGKIESAKIRVENIIRSDLTTELLEILELYCELLLARAGLLEAKDCDPGLEEAIQSLIYAAPKIEVKELAGVRTLLAEKYGKDFAQAASENANGKVAQRVLNKLRVEPPSQDLVHAYLCTIAEAYSVDWPPKPIDASTQDATSAGEDGNDDEPGDGQGVKNVGNRSVTDELSRATPPRGLGAKNLISVMPPSPTTDNVQPKLKLSGSPDDKTQAVPTGPTAAVAGMAPKPVSQSRNTDADDLAKRFAELKR